MILILGDFHRTHAFNTARYSASISASQQSRRGSFATPPGIELGGTRGDGCVVLGESEPVVCRPNASNLACGREETNWYKCMPLTYRSGSRSIHRPNSE